MREDKKMHIDEFNKQVVIDELPTKPKVIIYQNSQFDFILNISKFWYISNTVKSALFFDATILGNT